MPGEMPVSALWDGAWGWPAILLKRDDDVLTHEFEVVPVCAGKTSRLVSI